MAASTAALRGITKQYKDFTLGPVDMTVPAGSIVGLIGENGAGKTTLLKSSAASTGRMTARSTCWAALLPMPPLALRLALCLRMPFSTGASTPRRLAAAWRACMECGGMLKPLPGICATLGWTLAKTQGVQPRYAVEIEPGCRTGP